MWITWTYADCEVPALGRVMSAGDTVEVSDNVGRDLINQKRAKSAKPPTKSEESGPKSAPKSESGSPVVT